MTPPDEPILIIDDDLDDLEIIKEVFLSIDVKNEILFFHSGQELLHFLRTSDRQPLFILCDVNMPVMNGFALREEINSNKVLMLKSIPFLFLSTSAKQSEVLKAYTLTVQGYLKKPNSFTEYQQVLRDTVANWRNCLHPNSFK